MKKPTKIVLSISFTSILLLLLILGYYTGNPMVVRLFGGSEVDIVLRQERINKNDETNSGADTGEKNYLPPLPKYSYLTEDEANMIENPSFSSDDTTFYKAFPELLQARDTLKSVK